MRCDGFCATFRRLMWERGWTQGKMAKALGVYQSTVSKWMCGVQEPKASTVVRLAALLGVTTDELLGVKCNGD